MDGIEFCRGLCGCIQGSSYSIGYICLVCDYQLAKEPIVGVDAWTAEAVWATHDAQVLGILAG